MRIERLWVDVTAQVGATWANHFTTLELNHGLDINNVYHIWLLHYIFLPDLNSTLSFFAGSWNSHKIQIHGGPNRSPIDMFGFDMMVHGVRGDQLSDHEDVIGEEELEVYGIDWEGLQDETILHSRHSNNSADEDSGSWIGQIGPPVNLNEVQVDSPNSPLSTQEIELLDETILPWKGLADNDGIVSLWIHGLACARMLYSNLF